MCVCVCLLMKQCAIGVDYDRSAELKVYMLFLGVVKLHCTSGYWKCVTFNFLCVQYFLSN